VRTTLTLDDDIAAKIKAEAHRTGRSFRETVNEALRRGLATRRSPRPEPYRVEARDMGELAPGLDLDCIAGVLERAEGPAHR
jgi:hypothetical protein